MCVITPYNAQKNLIAEKFSKTNNEDQVSSIDGSQGKEFPIVFVSMVRTTPGKFIHESNRINVALTRAKHGLVIIGNAKNLMTDESWRKLLLDHDNAIVDGVIGAKNWIN